MSRRSGQAVRAQVRGVLYLLLCRDLRTPVQCSVCSRCFRLPDLRSPTSRAVRINGLPDSLQVTDALESHRLNPNRSPNPVPPGGGEARGGKDPGAGKGRKAAAGRAKAVRRTGGVLEHFRLPDVAAVSKECEVR